MKRFTVFLISVAMVAYISCSKGKMDGDGFSTLFETSEMPGDNIYDMVIDNDHTFYFVTSEMDMEAYEKMPMYSSYIPFKFYLSRRADEKGKFEVLDERFSGGKLFFDKKNQLWTYGSSAIYKVEGRSLKKIFELPEEWTGSFDFITVDNQNNIWAGGLQTGLCKIDNNLNVTHYNTNNSKLPTNSMTAIHVDKNNNIWIALWDNQGVLRISNEQWTVYNHNNSNITSQNIWCLVTDGKGHLWIGTGHDNENQSLMRFDGTRWETLNPRNDKNEIVKGTVRHLKSDGSKIYVVSVKVENYQAVSNELLTFDGDRWNKVYDIPENDVYNHIADLVVDNHRQVVWIRTSTKIFKRSFQAD